MTQWKIPFQELEFGERIGKGNFGEVYKGTYLGTDVAIKRLFFVADDFMQKYIDGRWTRSHNSTIQTSCNLWVCASGWTTCT